MFSSICNGMIWVACSSNKAIMERLLLPSIYNSQQYRGKMRIIIVLDDQMNRKEDTFLELKKFRNFLISFIFIYGITFKFFLK